MCRRETQITAGHWMSTSKHYGLSQFVPLLTENCNANISSSYWRQIDCLHVCKAITISCGSKLPPSTKTLPKSDSFRSHLTPSCCFLRLPSCLQASSSVYSPAVVLAQVEKSCIAGLRVDWFAFQSRLTVSVCRRQVRLMMLRSTDLFDVFRWGLGCTGPALISESHFSVMQHLPFSSYGCWPVICLMQMHI